MKSNVDNKNCQVNVMFWGFCINFISLCACLVFVFRISLIAHIENISGCLQRMRRHDQWQRLWFWAWSCMEFRFRDLLHGEDYRSKCREGSRQERRKICLRILPGPDDEQTCHVENTELWNEYEVVNEWKESHEMTRDPSELESA